MNAQGRLAVMQPYFFPYLGYFQLVASADTFVFFDDVNFIKKGWINRNNLLGKDGPQPFTIPLVKASQNRKISETEISGYEQWRNDFLLLVQHTYKRAPHYLQTESMIREVLFAENYTNISALAKASVCGVLRYIGLDRSVKSSSEMIYSGFNGQEKIISICELLGTRSYVNPINGRHLYDEADFRKEGIEISFLEAACAPYGQFSAEKFTPFLSIIDVLMFNPPGEVRKMTEEYKLSATNQ